ncbi:Crp/Fnr family transcriptional regulator [Azohydromonas lata]|uniref:Crp/Fnr family transcriptional regulator n=1 Tax=Azohydromonas lata TaxID=45677 RepID=UPI000A596742|nr:Crp/Fnr family transcriptional regulator [Azohydromonas lata]
MMLHAATPSNALAAGTAPLRPTFLARRSAADPAAATQALIADTLQRLRESGLPLHRRLVHAGDTVYRCGEAFKALHVLHSGFFKMVTITADGREQVVGLHFKGDWLGFDGIASGAYTCDAVALDVGEVWSVDYEALLTLSVNKPGVTNMLHAAMSRQMARERESILSLCTLSADARVADFLRQWVEALDRRGLRTDRITLCLTRAEIGNFLGMTLESVSRALSRLVREGVINFAEKGRRHVRIADSQALGAYIARSLTPEPAALQ